VPASTPEAGKGLTVRRASTVNEALALAGFTAS